MRIHVYINNFVVRKILQNEKNKSMLIEEALLEHAEKTIGIDIEKEILKKKIIELEDKIKNKEDKEETAKLNKREKQKLQKTEIYKKLIEKGFSKEKSLLIAKEINSKIAEEAKKEIRALQSAKPIRD